MSAPLQWCRADRGEFPPAFEWVWATGDFETVHLAQWIPANPPAPTLAEGAWRDAQGEPLHIIDWLPTDESPAEVPPPPARHPISRGGIAGFIAEE